MRICGGTSSPGIAVVSNKYTINVDNDEKKQINKETNTKTINQNNNNKLIQSNSTSSNNKNEEIIKNQESIKEEKKDKKKKKIIKFNN